MRSQKQIEASRRNGAKSRGPVTAAGKAISSRNSLRHGLRSRKLPSPFRAIEIDPVVQTTIRAEILRAYPHSYVDDFPVFNRVTSELALLRSIACLKPRIEHSGFVSSVKDESRAYLSRMEDKLRSRILRDLERLDSSSARMSSKKKNETK